MANEQETNMTSPKKENGYEPEELRRLFIRKLNYATTEESLKSHFEQWGDVVDCIVAKDPRTKKSRGFGFITYKTSDMVDASQAARPHKIDGRVVESKRAMPKEESGKPEAQITTKTLFVGLLTEDIGEEDLRDCFGKYGNIISVRIVTDKTSGKKRGFSFVEFDDYDPVDKVILRQHSLKGKRVKVEKSAPKQEMDGFRRNRDSPRSRGGARAGWRSEHNRGDDYSGYDAMNDWSNEIEYGGIHYTSFDHGSGGQISDYGYGDRMRTNAFSPRSLGLYGDGYGGGSARNTRFLQRSQGPYGDVSFDAYGSGYGGGPVRSAGFSQRSQGPYPGGYGGQGGYRR